MWIDTEGRSGMSLFEGRNGFLGKIVPVETSKLVNVHPTLRTSRLTTQRAGTSIVLQGVSKSRPTWTFDMT